MTASGSLPLILTLVALVVAATGYAGGRLHQWWRTGRDRDEAYREGYDTATRSVFSLAARVIGPRRPSVRGSAMVRAASADDGGTTAPMPPAPTVDGLLATPAPRLPSSAIPVRTNSASHFITEHFITDRPASPGDRDGDVVPLCFPTPDARLAGVVRPVSSHAAPDVDGDGPDPVIPASDVESSGRHTVPDELVQAVTYRLPADRVFRAKVPNRPVEELADDPTARLPGLPVPKPRRSSRVD